MSFFQRNRALISTEFLLTALVVVLVPGTGVICTVSTGLLKGGRAMRTPGIDHLLKFARSEDG